MFYGKDRGWLADLQLQSKIHVLHMKCFRKISTYDI